MYPLFPFSNIVRSCTSVFLAGIATLSAAPPRDPSISLQTIKAHPTSHVRRFSANSSSGYSPAQVRHAYGIDRLATYGDGQIIAIVVAYGSPTIQNDVNVFSAAFGIPNAALNVYYPQGQPTTFDDGWAAETALDVEWSHAVAPNAVIALVVAKSSGLTDLLGAVDYAVGLGAKQVSMSWGSSEFPSEARYDYHFNQPGVSFCAASGDNGAGVIWPAASPNVVGVGGSTLVLDSWGNVVVEGGWTGSGGGLSRYEGRPSFQNSWQGSTQRAIPDVCYNADTATGYFIYVSNYNGNAGWLIAGGTSAASPQWAGLFCIANQNRSYPIQSANTALYGIAGLNYVSLYGDLLTGSNGGFNSAPGYDNVTGLGSPKADQLVPALIAWP